MIPALVVLIMLVIAWAAFRAAERRRDAREWDAYLTAAPADAMNEQEWARLNEAIHPDNPGGETPLLDEIAAQVAFTEAQRIDREWARMDGGAS